MLLVVIPLLLALAPATAQTNMVYAGQTTELSVAEIPGDTYTWELYNDVTGVNFATIPGNCPQTQALFTGNIVTGPVIHVTWLSPGTYFFKVTAQRSGCTTNLKIGKIIVQHPLPTTSLILSQSSICVGESTNLEVDLTGTAPWSITYRITNPDATIQDSTVNNIPGNTSLIPFNPSAAGTYRLEVISVTDAFSINSTPSNSVILTVNAKPGSSHIYQYDPLIKKKK